MSAALACAERRFLSGNETLVRFPGVHAEWSVNEKLALEVALGASLAGLRALAAMTHVGVNVASDTLMSMGLTGVSAGLVIAVADDAGFSSSQNEQDSRCWARFAHLPVLEPAAPAEAYLMTREGFELSERYQMPLLLRLTTRVCHVKRLARLPKAIVCGDIGCYTLGASAPWEALA